MIRSNGRTWALLGGLAVVFGAAVLGGLALSTAGLAGESVATQSNDTDRNATNGSEPVAAGCPPADALRKEIFNALETRSIEEVRSTIPADAVKCLPSDVLEVLDLGNETDNSTSGGNGNETDSSISGANGNETDESKSADECPTPSRIRLKVNAALANNSKAAVRADFTDDEVDCLPSDVKDQLNIGDGASGSGAGADDTANDTTGDSASGVDCPSDEEIRDSVETALEGASAATVRAQIPDDYEDCLPADVKSKLNVGANATAVATATETTTPAESDTGTTTGDEDVDCPPAETIREEVNKTLEEMSAAQFRTMVPAEYVECFPPDVRERLGLTGEGGAASGDDSRSSGSGGPSADASVPVSDRDSELFDSDGDGVVNARDYAPNNSSVQFADSDDDGVPDPYDSEPNDPSVQDEGDAQAAADPGSDDGSGGDGIPVAAGSALLLVLAVGTGVTVYRHYGGAGSDDDALPQPADVESIAAAESSAETHDVFGESAFDSGDSDGTVGSRVEFSFDDHEADDGGFVFENDDEDEGVITLDSDGSVPDEESDGGFVFGGESDPELDEASEPADD